MPRHTSRCGRRPGVHRRRPVHRDFRGENPDLAADVLRIDAQMRAVVPVDGGRGGQASRTGPQPEPEGCLHCSEMKQLVMECRQCLARYCSHECMRADVPAHMALCKTFYWRRYDLPNFEEISGIQIPGIRVIRVPTSGMSCGGIMMFDYSRKRAIYGELNDAYSLPALRHALNARPGDQLRRLELKDTLSSSMPLHYRSLEGLQMVYLDVDEMPDKWDESHFNHGIASLVSHDVLRGSMRSWFGNRIFMAPGRNITPADSRAIYDWLLTHPENMGIVDPTRISLAHSITPALHDRPFVQAVKVNDMRGFGERGYEKLSSVLLPQGPGWHWPGWARNSIDFTVGTVLPLEIIFPPERIMPSCTAMTNKGCGILLVNALLHMRRTSGSSEPIHAARLAQCLDGSEIEPDVVVLHPFIVRRVDGKNLLPPHWLFVEYVLRQALPKAGALDWETRITSMTELKAQFSLMNLRACWDAWLGSWNKRRIEVGMMPVFNLPSPLPAWDPLVEGSGTY